MPDHATNMLCTDQSPLTCKSFLANVIVDPLENWSETEFPSHNGLHHKLVRGQWFHLEVISVDGERVDIGKL